MSKAMIVSVGGSPEPVIKSLSEFRPVFVSFLASQKSLDQIPSIKEVVRSGGHAVAESETTLVDDVEDLFHCYKKAEEAVSRVLSKEFKKDDVFVDYTGGTKNMSVALSLAAVSHGFSFLYVGGTARTKNGVGIVVSGHEVVRHSVNPWDMLAVEERKKISLLFNSCRFSAARDLAADLASRSTRTRALFKKLSLAIDGFYAWDMFKHRDALERFQRAKLEDLVYDEESGVRSFAQDSVNLQDFLRRTIETSGAGKRPCPELVADLFANAERRFSEGKVDDAVLRLYRLVEMIAQERLISSFGINASDVPESKIPDGLRSEYQSLYRDRRDERIKLPLTASFRLLQELGDAYGRLFIEGERDFADLLTSRNYSYLAHGFGSAKEATYTRFRDFVIRLTYIDIERVPRFPRLAM